MTRDREGFLASATLRLEASCTKDGAVSKDEKRIAYKVQLVLNPLKPERSKVRIEGQSGDYVDLDIEVEINELHQALGAKTRGSHQALVISKAKHIAIVGYDALLFLMLVAHPFVGHTFLIEDLSSTLLRAVEDTGSSANHTGLSAG